MRRRPTPLAVLKALVLVTACPASAWADSMTADYTLTVTNGTAISDPGPKPTDNSTLADVVQAGIKAGIFPQISATISPAGGVTAADPSVGPLTILSGSSGFNSLGLVDGLQSDSNGNAGKLGLIFFDTGAGTTGGFAANGVLHFSLDINSAVTSTPPTLTSTTPGVSITLDPPATPPPSGSDASPTNIPEPMSMLVWSMIGGLGVLRARASRRRNASATH